VIISSSYTSSSTVTSLYSEISYSDFNLFDLLDSRGLNKFPEANLDKAECNLDCLDGVFTSIRLFDPRLFGRTGSKIGC